MSFIRLSQGRIVPVWADGRRPITNHEAAQIKELARQKLSASEIGAELDPPRRKDTIVYFCKKHRIRLSGKPGGKQGNQNARKTDARAATKKSC